MSRNDPRILNPTFDFKIPWVEENEVEIDDDDFFISTQVCKIVDDNNEIEIDDGDDLFISTQVCKLLLISIRKK